MAKYNVTSAGQFKKVITLKRTGTHADLFNE